MSSITSSSGRSAASRRNSRTKASNRPVPDAAAPNGRASVAARRGASSRSGPAIPARPGTRAASASNDLGSRSSRASRSSGSRSSRRALAMGANGRPIPPIATQPPWRIRKPRSAARPASSRTNRLLPTPASPAMRRWVESRSATRSRTSSARASWSDRPMKTGLTARPGIAGSYGPSARRPGERVTKTRAGDGRGARAPASPERAAWINYGAGAAGGCAGRRSRRARSGDGATP